MFNYSNPLYAVTTNGIGNPALSNTLRALNGVQFIQRLLPALITMLLIIGSIIFLFVFLLGAVQWISSGGDKAALESAKSKITNALIGIAILLTLFAIINLIEIFFGTRIRYFNINSIKL
ncbi:hypothetical protein A2955_02570 [Candidatus Woesebacteria bacterium RIFCSPLOWO2_01_FULL_37_19]|uniref:Uncharacterized protein n=2 Tax=Candidatus Woeseibacteriota TaxID=1752722 RepID=A0A1F8AYG8_9BACT|nr:MAG: hypothetical protein A2771_04065 [Candidatus Woesebacteria bacterium RIFCSPHIGHO2_01_FULL_38_26b]OGM56791.1 MAG: hypothetical protein A2955_02570 [Candidatus Woesebacteria bacterium RIFCSPLOWO2_01_FULL_37_19]